MKSDNLIFVLGGGTSASPTGTIEGMPERVAKMRQYGYVLGINLAPVHVKCDGIVGIDRSFAINHKALWDSFGKDAHYVFTGRQITPPHATHWERRDKCDPTMEKGVIGTGLAGCPNAGLAAIHVAGHLLHWRGTVVLLGIDLEEKNDTWIPVDKHPGKRYHREGIIKNFEHCAPFFEKYGLKVYQTNKDSQIQCFEYKPLEEFLSDHSS